MCNSLFLDAYLEIKVSLVLIFFYIAIKVIRREMTNTIVFTIFDNFIFLNCSILYTFSFHSNCSCRLCENCSLSERSINLNGQSSKVKNLFVNLSLSIFTRKLYLLTIHHITVRCNHPSSQVRERKLMPIFVIPKSI